MKNELKSISKLSMRFLGLLMISTVVLVILNLIVLSVFAINENRGTSPWQVAEDSAEAMHQENGNHTLSEEMKAELKEVQAWAIFIDDTSGKAIWNSGDLPENIPKEYTLSEIASLTRGYLDGYPTFTGEAEDGLMVVGFPKDSYWKYMQSGWDYQFIKNVPITLFILGICNIAFIFIIYMATNYKFLKSVGPIVEGIQYLPKKETVNVKEKGALSELAANINQTSAILQSQQRMLKRKEEARSNWIAGVSHDIRTPLSMVMGYVGQLEEEDKLDLESRQKITVIRKQSEKMKRLIDDLNLASKLEYNMQPIHLKDENVIAVVREVAAEFMNINLDGKYPIAWIADEQVSACIIAADKPLLKRAISNLVQNSMNHNEDGCIIFIAIRIELDKCVVSIEDNGKGATKEQIQYLNNTPHYMLGSNPSGELRHGLGLLIVKQIVSSHGGEMTIEQSSYVGLAVRMILPVQELQE